jgi:hypothetical protein
MTILAGFNTDNGTNISGNANQPRAWKFAVTTTGTADKLVFKAATTTNYKFAIYALGSIGGVPTTQLATTVDVAATAGTVYTVNLSTPVSLTSGGFIAVAGKFQAGGNFFKGNTGSTNIALSATDSAWADPMDSPWSNTGGGTSSVPYLYLESSIVTITGIDRLETGALSTATSNDAGFVATTVTISDGDVSKTVAATDTGGGGFTFTPPEWVDGVTALKYGNVTVTANNGTADTADFADELTLVSDLSYVNATSVSAYNYGAIAGYSPPLKVGSQCIYDPDDGQITVELVYDNAGTGFVGTTQVWDRDPDTFIARTGNIVVSEPGGGGGMTSTGLTTVGLTMAGLTMVGL